MSITRRSMALSIAISVLGCGSLQADFLPISQPTAAYLKSTGLLDFTDADYTDIGALYGKNEVLFYNNLVEERTVPVSWNSWGSPPATETATPRVGYALNVSELTILLKNPATTFGFELEPNNSFPEEVTAAFYSGSTLVGTLDLTPSGNSGALLYAASTTTDPFTSVMINNLAGDSFAIARQRLTLAAASPEPGAFGLVGMAMAAGLLVLCRKQR